MGLFGLWNKNPELCGWFCSILICIVGISSGVLQWVDEIKRVNAFVDGIKKKLWGPLTNEEGCKVNATTKIEIRCKLSRTEGVQF